MAGECGAWVFADRKLHHFDATATPLSVWDLRTLARQIEGAPELAVNPYTADLWLADEKNIVRLSRTGQSLASWTAPGPIRRLAVAADQTLWALGNKVLWHYKEDGSLLSVHDLSGRLAAEPKLIALDSIGAVLWLAGEKQLTRLDITQPTQPAQVIPLPEVVRDIALDSISGRMWVALPGQLMSFERDGSLWRSIDVTQGGAGDVQNLSFDAATKTLWVRMAQSIHRLTPGGGLSAPVAPAGAGRLLAAAPLAITPALTLTRPINNGITNDPRPTISYRYDALCNNAPCDIGPDFLAGYGLTARANQRTLAPFLFDRATAEASHTPSLRLDEGVNVLTAQARDRFGHLSNTVTSSFTLDTVAPRFLSSTPADGAVVRVPQATLAGRVDDIGATVLLEGVGTAATQVVGGELSYELPVVLNRGLNAFVLTAIDKAGNTASRNVGVTYQPDTLKFDILSPQDGATVIGDAVLVGIGLSVTEQVGVTVNDVVATKIGDRFFAEIALQPGGNKLTITATLQNGQAVSKDITVHRDGVPAFQIVPSADVGFAPLEVRFAIRVTGSAQPQSVRADFGGSGQFEAVLGAGALKTIYGAAGVYQPRFEVTDQQGNSTIVSKAILVQDVTAVDAMLRAIFSGMLERLANRDIEGGLAFVHGNSRERFRTLFQTLGANLPSIIPKLGVLGEGRISADLAEYVISRATPSGERSFFIYFVRSDDGIWRIEAM
ncbi:hypothetical protein EEB15_14860 [Ramlibacter sp. WS9]|nr:hypothetical protein EEB15_14860 [Ramlibacter sp. WS9]